MVPGDHLLVAACTGGDIPLVGDRAVGQHPDGAVLGVAHGSYVTGGTRRAVHSGEGGARVAPHLTRCSVRCRCRTSLHKVQDQVQV